MVKLDPATGARLGTLVPVGNGGLSLPTYIAVIGPKTTATAVEVIEYFNIGLNKYFITGRTAEQAALDGVPAAFRRAGARFMRGRLLAPGRHRADLPLLFATGQGAGRTAILRPTGRLRSRQRHRQSGVRVRGRRFRGSHSSERVCPSSTPFTVYRSFNNRSAQNDGNHR